MYQNKQYHLISTFARHKVASNLLMLVIIVAGIWAIFHLSTQILPQHKFYFVTVDVVWPSASAEDVETSIINPLEDKLRSVDHVKKITSRSSIGLGSLTIQFEHGSDMTKATEQVRDSVSSVRNLPVDAEEPVINRVENFEPIVKLIVSGPSLPQLRPYVRQFERDLLNRGISKIEIVGLPEEQIAIEIAPWQLEELKLTLTDIAQRIADLSQDIPAGTIGRNQYASQLRALEQRRDIQAFATLPIVTDATGRIVRLGDIASIKRQPRESSSYVFWNNKPAVELDLLRSESGDILHAATIFDHWLTEVKPTLPSAINLHVLDEQWQDVKDRIRLILSNGVSGLLLIIAVLFIFLNRQVAFWSCVGIAVSFLGGLVALYLLGGSINMVSLFALIIGLGIIIDDNIVVSEETLNLYNNGEHSMRAAEMGAKRMLRPITAASITTICAFFPLLFISGAVGEILYDIPLVIICLVIASVIECFLILPNHLHYSFRNIRHQPESKLRQLVDARFESFKNNIFRPIVNKAIHYRAMTLTLASGIFVLALSLMAFGYVPFSFFINPEGQIINVNFKFVAGSNPNKVNNFLQHLTHEIQFVNERIVQTEEKYPVKGIVAYQGLNLADRQSEPAKGDEYGAVLIELISPDKREVTNQQFVNQIKNNIKLPVGLETITFTERQAGIPGKDLDIRITGGSAQHLKEVAIRLKAELENYSGLSSIADNLPYGQEQTIIKLTHEGEALGLTANDIAEQVRAAYSGRVAQVYYLPNEELEVRVLFPRAFRDSLTSIQSLPIKTADQQSVPLSLIAHLEKRSGFDMLLHTNGQLSINVVADVDHHVTNTNAIIDSLKKQTFPNLTAQYGVQFAFEGKNEEEQTTLQGMKLGALVGMILIYLSLVWVFSSYVIPLVIMSAVPIAISGAVFGHLLMGVDLTILSLFGFLGLAGIIVNDSIILVTRFHELRQQGMQHKQAIGEAACQRLRAVFLTSITTIAGLTPLLFEGSLQAQFLIPLAVSLAFGLAFGTVLILLVIPAALACFEKSLASKNLV
ncbi:MAG: efflux RND transporter permease subunit [Gammaproteobacteria bacterium]